MTTKPKDMNARALQIMEMHSKKSLAAVVRAAGWRGDDARTPMLTLALWLAGHEQETAEGTSTEGEGNSGSVEGSSASGSEGKEGKGEQPKGDKSDKGDKGEGKGDGEGNSGEGEQPKEQPQENEQEELPPLSNKEWLRLLELRQIKTPHSALRRVYELTRRGINVYLKGEAGTGKSTLARQLAKLLALPFGFISVTAGMSESQLLGWLLPIEENGQFKYVPSQLVMRCEHGGVYLLDELDAGDPNTNLVLNALLANKELAVPHRHEQPIVPMHAQFVALGAGNTPLGGGADEKYTARFPLDAATSDRFVQIEVDYDASYEASLLPGVPTVERKDDWQPRKNPATVYAECFTKFQTLRQQVRTLGINRIVSTRFLQKAKAMLDAGFTLNETFNTLTCFWSRDERSRVGIR